MLSSEAYSYYRTVRDGRERVLRNYWYIPAALLVVLVVVGFFAGWLQLSLGPDAWGVVFIRSRGFEKTAINPAGFSWRWQRLLPRSLTLYSIPIATERADLKVRETLPSGDAYSSLVPEKPDFSIEFTISVSYRIRPEALPDLVEKEGLRQETIAAWHQQLQAEMQRQAADISLRIAGSVSGTGKADGISRAADFADAVARELPGKFPQIQFISLAPAVSRMPDPELYAKLKSAYLNMVQLKQTALTEMAPRLAAEEAAQKSALQRQETSIALLTRYGELLSKYPSLIKFLFLVKAENLTARDLQTLDLLDKLPAVE
jgi:hypothetical protein